MGLCLGFYMCVYGVVYEVVCVCDSVNEIVYVCDSMGLYVCDSVYGIVNM